jgi:hypothetical protein
MDLIILVSLQKSKSGTDEGAFLVWGKV